MPSIKAGNADKLAGIVFPTKSGRANAARTAASARKRRCPRCFRDRFPAEMRRSLTLKQALSRGYDPEALTLAGRWPVTVPSKVCTACHAARATSKPSEIDRAVANGHLRESEGAMLKQAHAVRAHERKLVALQRTYDARAAATWVPVLRALKGIEPQAHGWALLQQRAGVARLVRRLDSKRGPVAVADLVSPVSLYSLTPEQALKECKRYGYRPAP